MVYHDFVLSPSAGFSKVDSSKDLLVKFGAKSSSANIVPVLQGHDDLDDPSFLARFPERLTGDLCWDRTSFADSSKSYFLHLSEEDIAAIRVAIFRFKELGLPPPFLEPATFPLPEELGNRLRFVTSVLQEGIGFTVLRGLNPQDYCAEDNIIVYAGLLSYIGDQRVTNRLGMSIEHIRNASTDEKPKEVEATELDPSKLPHQMKYHADRFMADILGLYVKEKAVEGGEQYIASFWSIYNELMLTDPSVVQTLAKDWVWPPPPENPHGDPITGPVIFESEGRIISQLIWAPFVVHPKYLTPERDRALHTVNELAQKMSIKIDCQVGDIQLINERRALSLFANGVTLTGARYRCCSHTQS